MFKGIDKRDVICGRKTFLEVITNKPHAIKKVFATKKSAEFIEREISNVPNFSINYVQEKEISDFLHTDSHQGIAALVSRDNLISIKDIEAEANSGKYSMLVALDGIQDAHNFGAILRSSAFFGIDGLIWSPNRTVELSPTVSKVSLGASEIVNLASVGNLGDSLLRLKKLGYWIILADVDDNSVPLSSFSFSEKTILVLGSEGKGVSKRVLKLSDEKVHIKGGGTLESLNVSNASAIFLYEMLKSRN